VTFRGDEIHNTEVGSGYVQIAGPITSRSLQKAHMLLGINDDGDNGKDSEDKKNSTNSSNDSI